MEILIAIGLFVVGACMGSFACCQVWRMHKKDKSRWSHCMKCKARLRWQDNVPVVSWIVLRGRCRKCKEWIGWGEILSEVLMGVVFVVAYLLWPEGGLGAGGTVVSWEGVTGFLVFLTFCVGLAVLFIYDLRWQKLPVAVLTFCVVCAMMMLSLKIVVWDLDLDWDTWGSLAGGLAILPGLYFVLYKASREKWVGGGDWILALALALVLADWWLALVCVFVGNFVGSIVGLVGRRKRMAFGPLLIVGFLVAFFAQEWLMGLLRG